MGRCSRPVSTVWHCIFTVPCYSVLSVVDHLASNLWHCLSGQPSAVFVTVSPCLSGQQESVSVTVSPDTASSLCHFLSGQQPSHQSLSLSLRTTASNLCHCFSGQQLSSSVTVSPDTGSSLCHCVSGQQPAVFVTVSPCLSGQQESVSVIVSPGSSQQSLCLSIQLLRACSLWPCSFFAVSSFISCCVQKIPTIWLNSRVQ